MTLRGNFPLKRHMYFEFKALHIEGGRIPVLWKLVLVSLVFLYTVRPAPVVSAEKSAQVNSEVQPHRWSAIRLSRVDPGTTLEVKLHLDGQATVLLVDSSQFKRYPRVTRPLFRMETRSRARFSVVAPKRDDYYVIIDNRKGSALRKYSLSVNASLHLPKNPSPRTTSPKSNDPLELLSHVIQTAFVVQPIKIQLSPCGSAKTLTITRGETVYLCRESFKRLKVQLKDKRVLNDIVLFALMREAGQVLLKRWEYTLIKAPNVKNEFATVLLLMFGRRQAVETQAKYATQLKLNRKELSKHLRQWLGDPVLVKKWQPFLVPKMRTTYMKILKSEGRPWASRKLIDRELHRRE